MNGPLAAIRALWLDIRDRGAEASEKTFSLAELGPAALAGVAAAAGQLADVRSNLARLPGLNESGCNLAVLLLLLAVLTGVIVAKSRSFTETPSGLLLIGAPSRTTMRVAYRYGAAARTSAKLAAVILIAVVAIETFRLVQSLWPLPATFYGRVQDERTGAPVDGLQIRLFDRDDRDLTETAGESDSAGFFIVAARERPGRSDRLRLFGAKCGGVTAPLSRPRTQSGDALGLEGTTLYPFFVIEVKCGQD